MGTATGTAASARSHRPGPAPDGPALRGNFLSTSHLAALGWCVSRERAAQMRLKRLHDTGYVDHFRPASAYGPPSGTTGSRSFGFSALKACEMVPDERRLYTRAAHQHQLRRTRPAARVGRASHRSGSGQDGRAGTHRPNAVSLAGSAQRAHRDRRGRRDGALTGGPAAAWHIPFSRASRTGYLEPDATLIGGSDEDLFAVLIEYDRTERPHKQIDRLRRYDRGCSTVGERIFAAHAIAPAVIFLTSREVPLNRLIETADETFSAYHAPASTRIPTKTPTRPGSGCCSPAASRSSPVTG